MISALLFFAFVEPQSEAFWCEWIVANEVMGAKREHVLWDGSRVDILSDEFAVEVDWSSKWAEGVGQAIYYGKMTGRKPVLLLLSENGKDDLKFHHRAKVACGNLVDLWIFDTKTRKLFRQY